MHWDPGALVGKVSSGMSVVGLAFPERLRSVSTYMTVDVQRRTIERSIHPPNIDQQTHHRHIQRRRPFRQQLILQNLTALATLRHSIEIDIRKRVPITLIRNLMEHLLLVLEDILQKVILNIPPPQWHPILLFQVPYLVPRIHTGNATIRIPSRRRSSSRIYRFRARRTRRRRGRHIPRRGARRTHTRHINLHRRRSRKSRLQRLLILRNGCRSRSRGRELLMFGRSRIVSKNVPQTVPRIRLFSNLSRCRRCYRCRGGLDG